MKKLKLQWVSDTIGNDYKTWNTNNIILLQAQTGTGKTWFIKNKLINNLSHFKRLLLVCNRINLKRQLKMDLLRMYHMAIPVLQDEKGNDTDIVDLNGLDKIYQIENITITSYQAIGEMAITHEYDGESMDHNYDYIVMDEAHFLFIDASFNNKCRLAYKYLVEQHIPFTIKIFISATMEEIKEPIEQHFRKYIGKKPEIIEYSTGIDYSYINPIYFKNDIDIIINSIKNDKSNEKWLVFVSNKEQGRKIQKELGDEISTCIFSGSNNEELKDIIVNSKFNKKVLITTKVLDNGINIADEKLTNIVIMAWDRITFMQELGRKRINIEDPQQINLYIPTRYKKSFIVRANRYKEMIKEATLLITDENAFNKKYDNNMIEISKMNHLFYHENMKTGAGA
jgi:superfamily II DNA or RNA helicase